MFYLLNQPSEEQFVDLTRRYRDIDPMSMRVMITLLRTGGDLLAAFEKLLRGYGLSQSRFLALAVLNRNPDAPMSPSELSAGVGVTRAGMTRLLDGLEREALVRREPHAADRRMLNLQLTSLGRELLEKILPDYWRRINACMAGLDQDEKELLLSLLAKVDAGVPALTKGEE